MNSLIMIARRRKNVPPAAPAAPAQPTPELQELPELTTTTEKANCAATATPTTATDATQTPPYYRPRTSKRWTIAIFTIGGIAGVLGAGFFFGGNPNFNLDSLPELRFDALADVIPAGILKEATDISVGLYAEYAGFFQGAGSTSLVDGIQQREKDRVSYDAFSVGLKLKAEGLRAEHPVIMVGAAGRLCWMNIGLSAWGV